MSLNVVFGNQLVYGSESLLGGERLGDDVHAIVLVVYHFLEASNLAFKNAESVLQTPFDFGIHVPIIPLGGTLHERPKMINRTSRVLAAAAASALVLASLTACAAGTTEMSHDEHKSESAAAGFSSDDIMFAQMMIPHHEQAIEMSTLAETRAENPEVRALAAKIKAAQAQEIEVMKGWLTKAGASLDMGHAAHMDGMLSEEQMQALRNASGAEFDRMFLEGMILHHEGAIEMTKMVTGSKNAAAHELGHSIDDSQTDEIAYMKELLGKL